MIANWWQSPLWGPSGKPLPGTLLLAPPCIRNFLLKLASLQWNVKVSLALKGASAILEGSLEDNRGRGWCRGSAPCLWDSDNNWLLIRAPSVIPCGAGNKAVVRMKRCNSVVRDITGAQEARAVLISIIIIITVILWGTVCPGYLVFGSAWWEWKSLLTSTTGPSKELGLIRQSGRYRKTLSSSAVT